MDNEKVENKNNPHGLGDPDDLRMRKIEVVLVEKELRKVARERCKDLVLDFVECAKDRGFLTPFQCRTQNKAQIDCMGKWFFDEELRKQLTEDYLKGRSEYRRTGIGKQTYERINSS